MRRDPTPDLDAAADVDAASLPGAGAGARPWLVLGAMALPLLALSIDVNGVGTILPSVQDTFDVPPDHLGLVINASTLAFAAVLIPVGRVAERAGSTRLLIIGVVAFGLMSLLCGLAPSFPVLLLGRVGQGVASALCFTTSLAVFDLVFTCPRRATAIGIWGSVSGLGGAIGPLVGGAVTTWWSWRGFFLVNVPLCLVAVPVIAVLTPRDRPHPQPGKVPWRRLCALSGSFVLLIGGLQAASAGGWTSPAALAQFVGGACLLALLGVDHRRTGDPTISPAVTRTPLFRPASVVAFASNWGFGVTVFAMGLYLQDGYGLSAMEAGLVFSSFSAAFAVAGLTAGRLVARFAIPGAMALAMAVAAAAFALQVVVAPAASLGLVVVALLVGGYGQGLAFDSSTSASLDGVPDTVAGEASGVVQTLRLLGLSAGIALSTTAFDGVDGDDRAALQLVMAMAGVVSLVGLAASLRSARSPAGRVTA